MNASTATARTLLTALLQHGVRDFVVAPGSRSAPLTYAIAELAEAGVVRAYVRIDERDAAFLALGIAKAARVTGTDRPVAVVTTSGTAVANLHPAILEASYAHLPLLALTADRPARLRATGANQTLDDQSVVLSDVRARIDVPAAGAGAGGAASGGDGVATGGDGAGASGSDAPQGSTAEAVAAAVDRAVSALIGSGRITAVSDGTTAGPVQLNVQFDAPLVPEPEDLGRGGAGNADLGNAGASGAGDGSRGPWWAGAAEVDPLLAGAGARNAPLDPTFVTEVLPALTRNTVILAGDSFGFLAGALTGISLRFGIPVLAEATSPLSLAANALPRHADVLAAHPELVARITDVIVLGKPTLYRPDAALLARADVRVHHVQADLDLVAPQQLALAAAHLPPVPEDSTWLQEWKDAAEAGAGGVAADGASGSEGAGASGSARDLPLHLAVARELLLAGGHLYVASSNAVRYLDRVMPEAFATAVAEERTFASVHASRGLAGIDGLVSTAIGFRTGIDAFSEHLVDENGLPVGQSVSGVGGNAHGGGNTAPAGGGTDAAGGASASVGGDPDAGTGGAAPLRLLIGDVAMLHDVGGLLREAGEDLPNVQIVVLNDNGGSIFAGLEHGGAHVAPYFQRFFATPHGRSFGELARAYDWPYTVCSTAEAVHDAIALGTPGIIEVTLPPVSSPARF
ncbi:thiamine pyrophosphate-binding protein [Brevibacterium samyangense]|uniref:2-succinyl-5-enolpyruvyl-6-hydroxy-3-cyclohexene-1-carboxylate synthase n=1 Tax=Brevibacterium samyangense TaxID=366888 RepID=A0ABN2THZ6_9MICO